MVLLVARSQALEDGDGVFDAGLFHEYGREAAFEGGVLFDVLAVLIQRGGADALHFAAGEGGLEHVGGVDGALRGAGADDGVELVDEEDDLALGPDDLIHDGFHALFELAAELRTGDHGAEVKGEARVCP